MELETAIGQLVDEAVVADAVIDVYALAGIETPELSILSDGFLDGIAHKDKPYLQMGMLRKLLSDEIRTVQRTNLVQARRFCRQSAVGVAAAVTALDALASAGVLAERRRRSARSPWRSSRS